MTSKEIEGILKDFENFAHYDGQFDKSVQAILALIQQAIGDYVEPHIKYCEEQNGLSFCKNCQLTRPKDNTNE